MGRVTEIMLAANDKIQANQADVLIYPDTDFVPAVTKNKEIIERAIRNGELAADSFIPQINSCLAEEQTKNLLS